MTLTHLGSEDFKNIKISWLGVPFVYLYEESLHTHRSIFCGI